MMIQEMTTAGERRITNGKAQGVMAEEAQIQKFKNGWTMKRTRGAIGLVLTGGQGKKITGKDH